MILYNLIKLFKTKSRILLCIGIISIFFLSCYSMQKISNSFSNSNCSVIAWPGWLNADHIQVKASCTPEGNKRKDFDTSLRNAQWAAVSLYVDAYNRMNKRIKFKQKNSIPMDISMKAVTKGGIIVSQKKLKDDAYEIIFKQPVKGIFIKTDLGYMHFPITIKLSEIYKTTPANGSLYVAKENGPEYWVDENTLYVKGYGKAASSVSNPMVIERMAQEAATMNAQARALQILVGAVVSKEKMQYVGRLWGSVVKADNDKNGGCTVIYEVKDTGLQQKVFSTNTIPGLLKALAKIEKKKKEEN